MNVQNKVMVVTGGGSGIGRALVLDLLKRGASVAAVDISKPGLQETANLAGDLAERLSTHIADITDIKAVALMSTIQTFPSPGRANRHIWGSRMRRKQSTRPMPTERAASTWPLSTAIKAPRNTSVENAP